MPRKGENIYKRKDGRWEGRYIKDRTLDGKAVYGYIYARSYHEVKSGLARVRYLLSSSAYKDIAIVEEKTLQEVADEWFSIMEPQIKESTCIKYHNIWNNYVVSRLGNVQTSRITHCLLESFCSELMVCGGVNGTELSSKTTADVLSVVRNMLRFAENRGYKIGSNGHSVSVKQSAKEFRVFSLQEQIRLCEYLNQNLNMKSVGILVCLYTGIRLGEICALQWEDVSLQEKTIYIHQAMQRIQVQNHSERKTRILIAPPKSSCSIRTIPLPKDLVQLIACCNIPQKGFFLTGSNEKYVEPRTMQYFFQRVLKSSSIENANFHTLRHTFATRCVELGFDIKSLSELLGHASINITMNRYVHPSMEWKRSSMEKLRFPFAVK